MAAFGANMVREGLYAVLHCHIVIGHPDGVLLSVGVHALALALAHDTAIESGDVIADGPYRQWQSIIRNDGGCPETGDYYVCTTLMTGCVADESTTSPSFHAATFIGCRMRDIE